jgi:hypothetical protein
LGRTVGGGGFSNDTVTMVWPLGNALVHAWYQVVTPNLSRTGAKLSGLFPFSIQRIFESANVIEDEIVSQSRGLQTGRDLLNSNGQVFTQPDKIQAIAESLHGDHVESLVVFDERIDHRTIIHRVIYHDDLGTVVHTDPPLLARVSSDGLELHCPTELHVFQRTLIISRFSDLREIRWNYSFGQEHGPEEFSKDTLML